MGDGLLRGLHDRQHAGRSAPAAWTAGLSRLPAAAPRRREDRHHGHTPVIGILDPDRARATWSMEDMLWFPPGGDRHHLWGVGFYFERYQRDPDGDGTSSR
ncbi:MAG: nuclear transport factor 2 family protein [Myxococcota bacterium]